MSSETVLFWAVVALKFPYNVGRSIGAKFAKSEGLCLVR
jgi:hypothetical protein